MHWYNPDSQTKIYLIHASWSAVWDFIVFEHSTLANTVHKSFGYSIQILGQRVLSKAVFNSPIKPGIMETPPASQRDKQMQNFCRFLDGWSFGPFSWKVTKIYDSMSKNGILRTKVCSASEVSVLCLLCNLFMWLLHLFVCCVSYVHCVHCSKLPWFVLIMLYGLGPTVLGWVKSQKVALLPQTYDGAVWL